jgi:hypothetical protein
VRVMPPIEIAARLGERFRLLAGGSRRAQERHRTLLATVSWSHDLLNESEKVVFRRLAVFPASFDLAAAEAIASDGDAIDVLECVLRLVDRSLVQYEPENGRYRLLETLRQYGADRLAEAGETNDTRDRHSQHFFALVDRLAPEILDSRYPSAHAVLTAELDNLRATADWCVDNGLWANLIDMARAMYFFLIDSAAVDGVAWYQQAIDQADSLDPQVVIDALGELSWITVTSLGDFPKTVALAERSSALAQSGRLEELPYSLVARSMTALYTADRLDGARVGEQALAVAEARSMETSAILALAVMANCLAGTNPQASADCALEALRRAELTGHPSLVLSTVISAASCYVGSTADFSAGRAILVRYDEGARLDTLNTLWLDQMWGEVLVGLAQAGGVDRLAKAIGMADRLSAPHVEDLAIRFLSLAAAWAGFGAEAAVLVGYSEEHFGQHRIFSFDQQWVMAQLEETLAELPDRQLHEAQGAASTRGQIMATVTQLSRDIAASERLSNITD